jgi:hypothetical protein
MVAKFQGKKMKQQSDETRAMRMKLLNIKMVNNMKKSLITMAALAVTMLATANPFFHYKEWKTPHGTYPFNDIKPEHYMPAF